MSDVPKWNRRTAALLLLGITLAAYWGVRDCGFVNIDDQQYVTEHPYVRKGLTVEGVKWAFGAELLFRSPYTDYWVPVTILSRMLDVQLFGMNPAGHHLVNVLLHAANVLLLFTLLHRLTRRLGPSAFAAALMAVHPIHVEAVAWITARKDVLSTLFLLGALHFYVEYCRQGRRRWLVAVTATYVVGLLAKPMIITLPGILLLLDVWPLRRIRLDRLRVREERNRLTRLVIEKVPLFIVALLQIGTTIRAAGAAGSLSSAQHVTLWHRVSTAALGYAGYLGHLIWPTRFAVLYPYQGSPSPWQVLVAVCLLMLITGLCLRVARAEPMYLVCWAWYLGTLLPVSGLIQVGSQARADRFAYVPFMGLYIGIGIGLDRFLLRRVRKPRLIVGTAAGIIAALVLCTRYQVSFWRDSFTLMRRAVEIAPGSALTHNNYGVALAERDFQEEAIEQYHKAIAVMPDFGDAYFNLGSALQDLGELDKAIEQYRIGFQFQPGNPEGHANLAVALTRKGQLEQALEHFETSLGARPDRSTTHFNYANALRTLGRGTEAALHYRRAIELDPEYFQARTNLGALLLEGSRFEEAAYVLRGAVAQSPTTLEAQVNLANALARIGDWRGAEQHYLTALRINETLPDVHNELGTIHAARQHRDQALSHFRRAIELDPDLHAARVNLARVLLAEADALAAIDQYREAIRRNPSWLLPKTELARLLATHPDAGLRDPVAALTMAEELAATTNRNDPEILGILAAAYAAGGQFEEASNVVRRALAVARKSGREEDFERLEDEVRHYEQGRVAPFRRPGAVPPTAGPLPDAHDR